MRAGATALFVTACQPNQRIEPKNPVSIAEMPEDKAAQSGTSYQRSCLISRKCSWPAYQAAVYDYVGAVYDLSGKVRYDEYLAPEEKAYVEQQMGLLEHSSGVTDFIGRARRKFFATIDPEFEAHPASCDPQGYDEDVRFLSYTRQDPQLGLAVVLGGVHQCGEAYGTFYLREGYEFQVAAQPEDWVFFLESNEYGEMQRRLGGISVTDETAHFERIADVLKIPVSNPLKAVSSEEVASYLERHGISRMETARQTVITMASKKYYDQVFKDEAHRQVLLRRIWGV